jgi:hypothetical protein
MVREIAGGIAAKVYQEEGWDKPADALSQKLILAYLIPLITHARLALRRAPRRNAGADRPHARARGTSALRAIKRCRGGKEQELVAGWLHCRALIDSVRQKPARRGGGKQTSYG